MTCMEMPVSFVEPSSRFPWLNDITAEAERADWDALRARLAAADTLDDQTVISGQIGIIAGVEDWLTPIVEQNPDDRLAAAVLAERLVHLAWEKRSNHFAEDLTEEQVRGFRQTLIRVETFLLDQIAAHPGEPHLWFCRVTSGLGMSVGLAEITRRYKRMDALAPYSYHGAVRYLTALYPKWYGSYPAALDFVRTKAAAAPDGSLMQALPMQYYGEQLLMGSDAEVKALLARTEVRTQLQAAARGSVLSPHHQPGPQTLTIHSNLALLFSLGQWWADAWPHFEALGPFPVLGLWQRMRDREGAYRQFFDTAQKAGQS